MPKVTIVFPCYNEATRLKPGLFVDFVRRSGHHLVMVNDGSTDDTSAVLKSLAAQEPSLIEALDLARNGGKAEAVRQGVLHAFRQGADIVGYADADLATPLDELARLLGRFETSPATVILGSRVALLGADIRRPASRHYLGRIFATAASLALGLQVYDTQCGAKFFRTSPIVEAAFGQPFTSRWAFDVELLGRLVNGTGPGSGRLSASDFVEVPLHQWMDVGGSKLHPLAMVRAGADLGRIALHLARRPGH